MLLIKPCKRDGQLAQSRNGDNMGQMETVYEVAEKAWDSGFNPAGCPAGNLGNV